MCRRFACCNRWRIRCREAGCCYKKTDPASGKRLEAGGYKLQEKVHSHDKRIIARTAQVRVDVALSVRVSNHWLLRAGLAPPNLPVRRLVDMCRDFNVVEEASIGKTSVIKSRDAFCEVIKGLNLNLKQVAAAVSSEAAGMEGRVLTVYMPHCELRDWWPQALEVLSVLLYMIRFVKTETRAIQMPWVAFPRWLPGSESFK